jgi:hypothetical protein
MGVWERLKDKVPTRRSQDPWSKSVQVPASRVRDHHPLLQRKYVLADRLRLLENELILDKNVITCLRVRYHKLYVLFLAISSMGIIVIRSISKLDVPRKNHRCVPLFHMFCITLRGTERHDG